MDRNFDIFTSTLQVIHKFSEISCLAFQFNLDNQVAKHHICDIGQ